MIPTLLALLLVQQPGPEEVFRKLEETLNRAPSLRVEFSYCSISIKEGEEDLRADTSGTFFVMEGDKLHATIPLPGKLPACVLVSNGQQLSCTWKGMRRVRPASGSGKWLSSAFARAGAYRGGSSYALALMKAPKEMPAVEAEMPMGDLAFGESGDGMRSLVYTVTLGAGQASVKTQLWYNPATLLPIKRVLWLKNPEHRITESYSAVVPNAVIPPEQFVLPSGEEKHN